MATLPAAAVPEKASTGRKPAQTARTVNGVVDAHKQVKALIAAALQEARGDWKKAAKLAKRQVKA